MQDVPKRVFVADGKLVRVVSKMGKAKYILLQGCKKTDETRENVHLPIGQLQPCGHSYKGMVQIKL